MKHNEEGTASEALMEIMVVLLGLANGRVSMAWIGKYSALFAKSKSENSGSEHVCFIL